MDHIFYKGQVLWTQIDANRHLKHSAYADFCAQARANMLKDLGLSLAELGKNQIGPILFREELIYYKEIHQDAYISVKIEMTKYNTVNSRFSFRHEIFREDGVRAAVVNVDGAWLDLVKRKLTAVPEEWKHIIERIPRSEDYVEVAE